MNIRPYLPALPHKTAGILALATCLLFGSCQFFNKQNEETPVEEREQDTEAAIQSDTAAVPVEDRFKEVEQASNQDYVRVGQLANRSGSIGVFQKYEPMSIIKKDGMTKPAILAMHTDDHSPEEKHTFFYVRYKRTDGTLDSVAIDRKFIEQGTSHSLGSLGAVWEEHFHFDNPPDETDSSDIDPFKHRSTEVHTHQPCGSFGCGGLGGMAAGQKNENNLRYYILDPAHPADQQVIRTIKDVGPANTKEIQFEFDLVGVEFRDPTGKGASQQRIFAVNLRNPVVVSR